MEAVSREALELPRGLGTVVTEVGREHHQGANDVEIRLPFEVEGCSSFRTTNGGAWLSLDRNALFLRDACVMLWIDLRDLCVSYLRPPNGEYFAEVVETATSFKCQLYTGDGSRRWLEWSKREPRFRTGMGPVVDGRFPSAYP
jgi:hypothetical protein